MHPWHSVSGQVFSSDQNRRCIRRQTAQIGVVRGCREDVVIILRIQDGLLGIGFAGYIIRCNPVIRTPERGNQVQKCDCYQPEPQQFKITLPDRYHRPYKDYRHHEQRPQHHQPKKRQGILANIQIHSPCARGDQHISHCAHSRQKNLQCPVFAKSKQTHRHNCKVNHANCQQLEKSLTRILCPCHLFRKRPCL